MKLYGKSTPLPAALCGVCDFALDVEHDGALRLLQITDIQIIDASQQRTPTRLRPDEIACWGPETVEANLFSHIRSLVAQAQPDLIFITGDLVYGEFDDSGRSWKRLLDFLDSLAIPWAPVFGNHDNETKMGVDWQCEQLTACRYCLFARGTVTGNSNYAVMLLQNGTPVRLLHMLDSHGCLNRPGIETDQVEQIAARTEAAQKAGIAVPAFAAYHIPTPDFLAAERAAGYTLPQYAIGVQVPTHGSNFGGHMEVCEPSPAPRGLHRTSASMWR